MSQDEKLVTPPSEAPSTVSTAPLTSYEDCISLLENLRQQQGLPDTLPPAFNRLIDFFKLRLSKKQSKEQSDPDNAVKRAVEARSKFKPYVPSATTDVSDDSSSDLSGALG